MSAHLHHGSPKFNANFLNLELFLKKQFLKEHFVLVADMKSKYPESLSMFRVVCCVRIAPHMCDECDMWMRSYLPPVTGVMWHMSHGSHT